MTLIYFILRFLFLLILTLFPKVAISNVNDYSSITINNIPECPSLSKISDIRLAGMGWKSAKLSNQAEFDIFIKPSETTQAVHLKQNDTVIKARLYGDTIVKADVVEMSLGHFKISYLIRDKGEYYLQVRI